MPSTRLVALLLLLLAVQGRCKPTKSTEADEYNDDVPDYNDDYSTTDEDSENDNDGEPQIISQPVTLRKRVGSTAVLPCMVTNTAKVMVIWEKDNQFLYSDDSVFTTEPDRIVRLPNNTLVIYNLTPNDTSNNYACAIMTTPRKSIVHKLYVEPSTSSTPQPSMSSSQPSSLITVTPSNKVHVRQGENITLGCHTNLQPSPEIKWYRQSNRIHGNEAVISGNYITIHKITRHQAGFYQCLADNGNESPPHAVIEVTVDYTPEIEAERDVVHTGVDIESDLTCIVHARPRARVMWYKDRKEVIPKKGRFTLKEHKNKHILKITHTMQEDFGLYTCMATNEIGQASKTISLTGVPSRARIYGGEMTKNDSGLILKWRLESYSEITEYKLKYRRKDDEEWITVEPPVTKEKGVITVEYPLVGLEPGSYEAILAARNNFGWSPLSEPHVFTGDYVVEAQNVQGSSGVVIRPFAAVIALLLVVSTCAFPSP